MTEKEKPNYQPISMLPTISYILDGAYESAVDQLESLLPVVDRPHALDSDTVERIITLYTEQADGHWVFEEQFKRWEAEELSSEQSIEIDRLKELVEKTKVVGSKILNIANDMKGNTIDDIMAMDEMELALKFLSGEIKPPK